MLMMTGQRKVRNMRIEICYSQPRYTRKMVLEAKSMDTAIHTGLRTVFGDNLDNYKVMPWTRRAHNGKVYRKVYRICNSDGFLAYISATQDGGVMESAGERRRVIGYRGTIGVFW